MIPPMPSVRSFAVLFTVLLAPLSPPQSEGAVAVLGNRTVRPVVIRAVDTSIKTLDVSVEPGSCIALPITAVQAIVFRSQAKEVAGELAPSNAYVFEEVGEGEVILNRLLVEDAKTEPPVQAAEKGPVVINLRLLVDDEEPGSQRGWEARLRHRVALASALLERDCRLTLKVVEVDTWQSDDSLIKLNDLLTDFERKVKASDAYLTIGWSSQHVADAEQPHLGVTRSPLHTHILIGEGTRGLSEAERLEVLIHELGHYLGARHCSDRSSIMRGQLGDRQARSKRFRLGMDPLNLLAMNLVADEVRRRQKDSPVTLSVSTQSRLRQIYDQLEPVKEPTADSTGTSIVPIPERGVTPASSSDATEPSQMGGPSSPLVKGTRKVIDAVRIAAQANTRVRKPVSGDALAELYVRAAAQSASEMPAEIAGQAFVRGIAIACDHGSFLRHQTLTKAFCSEVEGDAALQSRLRLLGQPTLQGRSDLWQHFTVSMYLTASFGAVPAEAAGLAKEHADARGGSGFSFADLLADFAGIALANQVLREKAALQSIAGGFTVASRVPPIDDLAEGLSQEDLRVQYGEPADVRFRQAVQQVRARLEKHTQADK